MRKTLILLFFPIIVFGQKGLEYYKDYMPVSACDSIIHYEFYSASYCSEYKLSEWTIYHHSLDRWENVELVPRRNNWRMDLEKRGINQKYFRYSGWDRGHSVPARNMSFDELAMKECFYTTNVVPMTPRLNRGFWKRLEYWLVGKERQWAKNFEGITIISGWTGILGYMTEAKIPIPEYYYKIIVDIKANRALAFLIPQYPEEDDYGEVFDYIVSFEELESVTGIDFFYKLDDDIESEMEGLVSGDINKLKKNQ